MNIWRYVVIAVNVACVSVVWSYESAAWHVANVGLFVLLCVDAICAAIKQASK